MITRAELAAMPDDGRRHELVDGTLLVTPAPGSRHQAVVVNLLIPLHAACPADLRVRTAPFDVTLADDSVVQPDLLVARAVDIDAHGLSVAPVLVVEVLSASTRLLDLHLKRARYAEAGVASYWVVDPDDPGLVAWELRNGTYVEVGRAAGDEVYVADRPFPTRITPGELVDRGPRRRPGWRRQHLATAADRVSTSQGRWRWSKAAISDGRRPYVVRRSSMRSAKSASSPAAA